jgi:NAD(P)-dependent dehydrogenase (short-subunit alcohol dehydrogenase family)
MRFENKVVVITGAGAGIGKATAAAFAAEGATIVAGEIDGARLNTLVTELSSKGTPVLGVLGNVAQVEDCNKLVDAAKSEFGRLDVLVNNAGIMDRFLPVTEVDDALWNRVLGVNLNGTMYTMRRAIPLMVEQGHGVIINITSAAGLGGGFAGAAYTTSKHAVIGLTKNSAVMYAKQGIRCLAVCPGAVSSGMPLGGSPSQHGYAQLGPNLATIPRTGKPEEIASVIVLLASDEADFVNGAVIPVDGSWLAAG